MVRSGKNQTLTEDAPTIVLIKPQLPENIGMVARAMANFGLTKLRLVRPREKFPCKQAYAVAKKADHLIDNAVVFNDMRDAIADINYVLATTARARDGFKPVASAVESARALRLREQSGERTAILFGCERFGLSNEEISLADEIVTFPVSPTFSSLNIAQAVLLMSYEWMKSSLIKDTETVFRAPRILQAGKETLHGFFAQLEEMLDVRGYFRPQERKEVMISNLRSILTRAGFSDNEVKLLRGIISSLDRFSPQKPRGSGAHRIVS
ncbi:MAG: tRNA/rRNA methyltransferase [Candidatus Tokpelaia sp. JSC188]|nr:MAG: tRNA/rRNA methyltransferase [Candidatus Tokpelaia sp. JSC188]